MAAAVVRFLPPDSSFVVGTRNRRHSGTRRQWAVASSSSKTAPFQHLESDDFYKTLGVPIDATTNEIRKAYRQLQKKHHPDVSGSQGHEMTLLLNKAYETLSSEILRSKYNASLPHLRAAAAATSRQESFVGNMYSTWNGPDRPQGIFVDENACIGCRECALAAKKTFLFDEAAGCARVKTQWGDPEDKVKTAIEACPVNCIHLVERTDVPILEYLMRPRPKPSNGVFGGAWERPFRSNVFSAVKTFKRQMESANEAQHFQGNTAANEETPAQRKARVEADRKLRMRSFWKFMSWMMPADEQPPKRRAARNQRKRSKALFGKSCTSEVANFPLPLLYKDRTVKMVQEWAVTFASSSEIPLPMPFRADVLDNGVKLSFVSTGDGVLKVLGVLYITIEEADEEVEEEEEVTEDIHVCYLSITRQGSVNTRPLPGERRVIKLVQDMLLVPGDKSYTAYHIPSAD